MHASANIPQNGPGFTKKMLPMRNLKFATRFVIHNVQLYSSLELRLILNVNQLQFYMGKHVENFLVITTLSLWNGAQYRVSVHLFIARWICHASFDSIVYYCARELPCLQVIILFILSVILSPSQSCMYSAPNQVPKLKKSKVIVFHKTRLQGLFSQIPIQRYSNISVCERKHNYYSPFHFYIRKVLIFQTKVSFNN